MEPRQRASPKQFSLLIDFMERHGDLSKPQSGPQGRIKSDRLWQHLTVMLNSLGGGGVKKSSYKWKKVWADWKTKTKKKYLSLKLQSSHASIGPSSRTTLTALEKRVVAIIGASAVVGQAGIQERGFHLENDVKDPLDHAQYSLDIVLEDHNSQNIATPAMPAVDSLPHPEEDTQVLPPSLSSKLPPPSLPHTYPVRNSRRQASTSSHAPSSPTTTPRRPLLKPQRNRGMTPFERAADLFATIEQRRLVHEEERDKRLHEREMERLRLEAERIEVTRQQNNLLHQLSLLGQRLIDVITQQPSSSLPSMDPI